MKPANKDYIIRISGGRGPTTKFEAWRYWEIIGELIWKGADRMEAYDAGKWTMRAPLNAEKNLQSIKIFGNYPDIIMKVVNI